MQDQRAKENIIQEAKSIHKDWLRAKITIEEAEAAYMVKNKRLGPEPVPFGFSNAKWIALLDLVTEGDELWEFSSSAESWQALAGREGIALVRNGEIIAAIVTIMS